ncbi:MAG: DUF2695 domain-containing protein [Bacteroidota bacterium]
MADKDKSKQIRDELRQKVKEEFESNLPMIRERFRGLFDYLDSALQAEGCKDDLTLTVCYLRSIGTSNIDQVTSWLNANGGFCDCEVLSNVEEQFEQ